MRRTQLYLDEDIWQALRLRAKQTGTTVSEIVRQTVREALIKSPENRKRAMEGIIGLWSDRTDIGSTEEYVRGLRKDTRLERLK